MNNNFEFKSEEDLFLRKNGELELRFLGDGNAPYFYLPFQLWLLEKQMTGNNCFGNYGGKHDPELNREYRDKFFQINKFYIPAGKKIPTSDAEFNSLLDNVGLTYLSTMDPHKIVLEQNVAIVRRVPINGNSKNPGFEILRYTPEDIQKLNKAYRTCMQSTPSAIIKNIYNEIAYQIYLDAYVGKINFHSHSL